MRTWLEVKCCHCGEKNFLDNGDESDVTVTDIEGFWCWKCQTNNEFNEEGEVIPSQYDQLDEGLKSPR